MEERDGCFALVLLSLAVFCVSSSWSLWVGMLSVTSITWSYSLAFNFHLSRITSQTMKSHRTGFYIMYTNNIFVIIRVKLKEFDLRKSEVALNLNIKYCQKCQALTFYVIKIFYTEYAFTLMPNIYMYV